MDVTSVYYPPTGNVQNALDRLEIITENIKNSISEEAVIIGDLNIIHLLNDNIQTKKIGHFCSSCGVEQIVRKPTRISNKSCTLMDHIYTNACQLDLSGVINCNISDHLPVFLVLNKSQSKPQYKQVYGRSFRDQGGLSKKFQRNCGT